MSVQTKVGNFAVVATGVGTTLAITGVGFKPQVILFMASGQTGSVDASAKLEVHNMFGVAAATTDRRVMAYYDQNNVSPTQTASGHRTDCCIAFILNATGPTWDGQFDLQSFDTDGFTLVVNATFSAAFRVFYLAIGGDEITNVKSGQWQSPSSSGNQAITGVGFKPDALIVFGGNGLLAAPTDLKVGAGQCLGVAAGNDKSTQCLVMVQDQNGVATSVAGRQFSSNRVVGLWDATNATTIANQGTLSSFDSDGFTINWTTGTASGTYLHYLAIKGAWWTSGMVAVTTDNNAKSVTGIGSQCKGGFAIHCQSTLDQTTRQNNAVFGVGVFDNNGNDMGLTIGSANASNPAVSLAAQVFTSFITGSTAAGGFNQKTALNTLDANGFTFQNVGSPPGVANLFTYLLVSTTEWLESGEYRAQ